MNNEFCATLFFLTLQRQVVPPWMVRGRTSNSGIHGYLDRGGQAEC